MKAPDFSFPSLKEALFGHTLLIATTNSGKLLEISEHLSCFPIQLKSLEGLGMVPPEETEPDFLGNALIKARAYSRFSNLPTLADDSGLVIPSLAGYPGVYAGRVAEEAGGFEAFFPVLHQKLLKEGRGDNRAVVVSALVLMLPDGSFCSFEGRIHCRLVFPPQGEQGLGYDPILQPEGCEQTFAEDPDYKRKYGHRARALEELARHLREK